jgi:hypothetical protein
MLLGGGNDFLRKFKLTVGHSKDADKSVTAFGVSSDSDNKPTFHVVKLCVELIVEDQ